MLLAIFENFSQISFDISCENQNSFLLQQFSCNLSNCPLIVLLHQCKNYQRQYKHTSKVLLEEQTSNLSPIFAWFCVTRMCLPTHTPFPELMTLAPLNFFVARQTRPQGQTETKIYTATRKKREPVSRKYSELLSSFSKISFLPSNFFFLLCHISCVPVEVCSSGTLKTAK